MVLSFLYSPTLTSIHDYWKNNSLDYMTFVGKVMSLFLNMLSRLVITFLPRSKHLLIPLGYFKYLEKEMATHSTVLAWRIPGTGEPGGLPSMGSHRVGHD